jgi:hypothetical protein
MIYTIHTSDTREVVSVYDPAVECNNPEEYLADLSQKHLKINGHATRFTIGPLGGINDRKVRAAAFSAVGATQSNAVASVEYAREAFRWGVRSIRDLLQIGDKYDFGGGPVPDELLEQIDPRVQDNIGSMIVIISQPARGVGRDEGK